MSICGPYSRISQRNSLPSVDRCAETSTEHHVLTEAAQNVGERNVGKKELYRSVLNEVTIDASRLVVSSEDKEACMWLSKLMDNVTLATAIMITEKVVEIQEDVTGNFTLGLVATRSFAFKS
ncbi:hypothetical protein MRX96_036082 [Rhipicephalus microplus]